MIDAIKKSGKIGFQLKVFSPYIFTAHHKDAFPKGNVKMEPVSYLTSRNIGNDFNLAAPWRMYYGETVPGFPRHPHRGFETITVVTEGMVDHSDGSGAGGRYGNGDVQWMTAGSGMQHCEMFPLLNQDAENPMELFQIWLNLPAARKFVDPYYKMLWNEEIPTVTDVSENGNKTTVRIVNGSFNEHQFYHANPDSWAADPANHVNILLIKLEPGTNMRLPVVPEEITRVVYFYEGSVLDVAGVEVINQSYHVLDGAQKVVLTNTSTTTASILLLDGRPIDEPVVAAGPFVMNTNEEIEQAFYDYRQTEFGGWPWRDDAPVHDRNSGRFAQYADGTLVKPPEE